MREAALRKLKVSTVVRSASRRTKVNSGGEGALEERCKISVNSETGDEVSGAQERIIGEFFWCASKCRIAHEQWLWAGLECKRWELG